jgi:hypothetical protein
VHEGDELITPADAFKLLLRDDILFDEILARGRTWFESRYYRAVERSDALDRSVLRIAKATLKTLRNGVKSGSVRLYASFDGGESKLIPLGDQQDGDLNVFERRLEVYKQGGGFAIETVYKRVRCIKADVLQIIPPATKTPSPPLTQTPAVRPMLATRLKSKHRQKPVKVILALTYPDGIPQGIEPAALVKQVGEEWSRRKESGDVRFLLAVPSKNTILRAAGLIK